MSREKTISRYHVGARFGILEIISAVEYRETAGKNRPHCCVRCLCGSEYEVLCFNLSDKSTCSACLGRKNSTIHGHSKRPIFRRYLKIIERCYNPKCPAFHNYGGRGILVCDEWRADYLAFENWAFSNGYEPHLEIDRIDNNKGYSPENCRWVTSIVNARNKRLTVRLTLAGETKSAADWAEDPRCAVSETTLTARIRYGWDHVKAILTPARDWSPLKKKGIAALTGAK